MNAYRDELVAIAMASPGNSVFHALDKLAKDSRAMTCRKCGREVTPLCPVCACQRPKATQDNPPDGRNALEVAETGGVAAAADTPAGNNDTEHGKYAFFWRKKKPVMDALPRGLQDPAAVGVVVSGLLGGNELRKLTHEPEKTAGTRFGNPVLNLRREGWKSMIPSKALKQLGASLKSSVASKR